MSGRGARGGRGGRGGSAGPSRDATQSRDTREQKPKKEEPKADLRAQFFSSIRSEKLEILRNCLANGNVSQATRDDEDHTGIHIAAASNKQKSLRTLIEHIDLRNEADLLELTDEGGRTALMMAAANGHIGCVKELIRADAVVDAKCTKGYTAKDYAERRGHTEVLEYLLEQMSVEEVEVVEFDGEETSTQRNRRLRKELEAGSKSAALKKKVTATSTKPDSEPEPKAEAEAPVVTEAKWPEVKKLLEDKKNEITINRLEDKEIGDPVIDPALWSCISLNRLQIRMPTGALVQIPAQISRLSNLAAIIFNHNALSALPNEIGLLHNLKIVEASYNTLSSLPLSFSGLTKLEVLDVSYNQITSLEALASLSGLVSINVDFNKIPTLDVLPIAKMERLSGLSACGNQIAEIPAGVGRLQNMSALNLKDNLIEELPRELADLSEKKLKTLNLEGNPLEDKRAVKILQSGRVPVKELFQHIRKNGSRRSKKSGKKSAVDEDEDDEENDEGHDQADE